MWAGRPPKRLNMYSLHGASDGSAGIMLHVNWQLNYRGADKSLSRQGRKQAEPVTSVLRRGMD